MNFSDSVNALSKYVESCSFKGCDPYDALMGWSDFRLLGKWAPAVLVQLHKRNPLNFRPLMGIPKMRNAKAMGLFLSAYGLMDDENARIQQREIFDWLCENQSPEGGWGYPFHWANPEKFLPAGTPSAVVTGFVSKGIYDYFSFTHDTRAVERLDKASQFVTSRLPRTETADGLCFSYTAARRDCCYNASLLAAEVLARLHAVQPDEQLCDLVKRAVDFVVAHQHADGHWNYSLDLKTGMEREQIDFHQGFILDSLHSLIQLCKLETSEYQSALIKGMMFYREQQFFPDGRSKWRLPHIWPVDIHHQAQGIITLSKLKYLREDYLSFAHTIAKWTIEHMQDRRGFFYYQKHRWYTNRIPYMRWSQAWMMLALATLQSASSRP